MKLSLNKYCCEGKKVFSPTRNDCNWDLFISAFNDSERVRHVFNEVKAKRKIWWLLPEYGYSGDEILSQDECIKLEQVNEDSLVIEGINALGDEQLDGLKICIDITGFMRPHLLFLMKYLPSIGICDFDMIYTEPNQYALKSETKFTNSSVTSVRTVAGYGGVHSTDLSNDHLIVGVGYDHELIGRVVAAKESARFIQLHSFPSLSADMYHESLIRLSKIDGSMPRIAEEDVFFSSANDPFVTASVLCDSVGKLNARKPITNLYLSPLATKVQTIGFGLFYLKESLQCPVSMIFPFSSSYNRNTSSGVGRTWLYPIVI